MNWRKGIIGLMGVALLCFAGCGANSKSEDVAAEAPAMAETSASAGKGEIYDQPYLEEEGAVEENGGSSAVATARKLIKNVHMEVETEEFDLLVPKVESRVSQLGGYIESMNVYNGSSRYGGGSKSADMTIRIPKDRLDEFVTAVSEESNVIRREESVEDVTMQYVDLESRKKALTTEQDRLLDLLGQAQSIEDIIVLEERLSQVRYELESMEAQLRTYDNQIEFSTLYLYINEVERLTPVAEVSALQKMAGGFLNSLQDLGTFLSDFLIGLVIYLPYLLFLALLAFAVIILIRIIGKRRKAKQMIQDWKVQLPEEEKKEADRED